MERIYIDSAINKRDRKYICPICGSELIIKSGNINTSHFAHKSKCDYDTFVPDMSQWHKDWQNVFPKKNQEVVLTLDISKADYIKALANYGVYKYISEKDYTYAEFEYELDSLLERYTEIITLKHRTDVLACGYAIEFQHSPISQKEFDERNWFYLSCGKKVVWIFDLSDKYYGGYIKKLKDKPHNKQLYDWKYPLKTFQNFLPKYEKDIIVFFQLKKESDKNKEIPYIGRVVWAIDDDKNDIGDYSKFILQNDNSLDKKGFLEKIKNREIK